MPAAPPLMVVALGGNAIQDAEGDDSVASDFARSMETARHLVALAGGGPYRLVVVHGNGPQVGNHLLRSELGHQHGGLPLLPLDVCVADTQGGMGYMLQQCLSDAFHAAGHPAVVVSLVTQTVVSTDDPAFDAPSKPVGELVAEERLKELRASGWVIARDQRGRGWRRVVASPDPIEIVEAAAIEALVGTGVIVVCAGGGGIPVAQDESGILTGVPAVVDKDLAAALLAIDLGADALSILTDVDHVSRDYGGPAATRIAQMTVSEARALLAAGEFPSGTMGPKVEAAARFAETRGSTAVITSVPLAQQALAGDVGTRIVP